MDIHSEIKKRLERAKDSEEDETSEDEENLDEVHEKNIAREAKELLQEKAEERQKEEQDMEERIEKYLEGRDEGGEKQDIFDYTRDFIEDIKETEEEDQLEESEESGGGDDGDSEETEDHKTLPCPECETPTPVKSSLCVKCQQEVELSEDIVQERIQIDNPVPSVNISSPLEQTLTSLISDTGLVADFNEWSISEVKLSENAAVIEMMTDLPREDESDVAEGINDSTSISAQVAGKGIQLLYISA